MNFYRADPALTDLLRIHLPDALFRHIEPHLDRLGALAGGHLDECARLADRHVPVLHQRDRFGRDAQWIEYHPAYRELEKAAFGEFGIHAMSLRKGIMGWPQTLSGGGQARLHVPVQPGRVRPGLPDQRHRRLRQAACRISAARN